MNAVHSSHRFNIGDWFFFQGMSLLLGLGLMLGNVADTTAADDTKAAGAAKKADREPAKGAKPATKKEPAKEKDKPAAGKSSAKDDQTTHRLPPYYGQLVDDKQRDEIYKIQDRLNPAIQAAEEALAKLVAERNKEFEAVLTAKQRKELAALRAAAKDSGPQATVK